MRYIFLRGDVIIKKGANKIMKALQNGMTIGKAKVIVDIIPNKNYKIRPGRSIKPGFVTYHNTGNQNRGANAEMHNRYIHNMASYDPRDTSHVSWHLTVDEDFIYQHIPFDENAWHCGDGSSARSGNMTSVGIEICHHSDQGNYAQAEENAIALGLYLAEHLNIPIEHHVPHQKWSGKYCPSVILRRDGSFTPFHDRIKSAGNVTVVPAPSAPKPSSPVQEKLGNPIGKATILVASLNVRAESSFQSSILGTVSKGQVLDVYGESNGLYRIKEGYISAGTAYVSYKKSAAQQTVSDKVIGKLSVLAYTLNVRQRDSLSSSVVGTVSKGQSLNVYETRNGMHRIGASRWVSASTKYVRYAAIKNETAPVGDLTTNSIVDYLASINESTSFANRKKLAEKYGVPNYSGTADQNLRLLDLMRKGTSNKPVAPKGDQNTSSIVTYLNSIEMDSSFSNRQKLAIKYGITNYKGTAEQNTLLLKKMRG